MFDVNQCVGIYSADIETTGLLDDLIAQGSSAKLHNFCATSMTTGSTWTFHCDTDEDRERIAKFLDRHIVLVMHNGIGYDKKALELLGFDVSKVLFIDSLAISWYLDRDRARHGLESYGDEFGVPKPEIKDWKDLTQADYDHRVQEDVKIQALTYKKLKKRFEELYGRMSDIDFCNHKCIRYLMFKMRQLADQADVSIKIDRDSAEKLYKSLSDEVEEKLVVLRQIMPKVPVKAKRKPPAKPFKLNRELSATGQKWKELTEEHNLPFEFQGTIEVVTGYEEPNPQSPQQVKDWLFTLGWVPLTFEFKKDDDGNTRSIPQVYIKNSGGEVCPSIVELSEELPDVMHLVGLGVLKHRRSLVKGFLDRMDADGTDTVVATAGGFTNTLRLKHKAPCVNLPSLRASKGKEIRGMLIAKEGKMFCGADLSALENILKFNFQYPHDPEYVDSQMKSDFDPHLEIAYIGGLLTRDQINFWKIYKEGLPVENYPMTPELERMLDMPEESKKALKSFIEKERGKGKSTNYACLPMDTEVLTVSGFKPYGELSVGDRIISYKEGKLVEDTIQHLHFYQDAEVIHYGDSKKVLRATMNHRWLTTNRSGSSVVYKTLDSFNTETKIITTAPYIGGKSEVTVDEASLVAWILSDGSFGGSVTIAQSKGKYFEEVESLVKRLGLYTSRQVSPREDGNDVYIYNLKMKVLRGIFSKLGLDLTKDQDFSEFILGLSKDALEAFVESFWLADGDTYSGVKSFVVTQNSGKVHDAVQLAMYLLGTGRVVSEAKTDKCRLIRKHKAGHITCQKKGIQGVTHEDVFCLTTGNGNFVIKQDNEIMLTGNCQYGAGAKTVARTAKIELELGQNLVQSYKKLNWSINAVADEQVKIKTSFGMFQLNPLNGLLYNLKVAKDSFSTLIQGSGSYILDLWLLNIYGHLDKGTFGVTHADVKLLATFHDELILEFDEELKESVRELVRVSLEDVNTAMLGSGRITIPFGCDIQFGKRYSEIH